jgi:hypothetical protein
MQAPVPLPLAVAPNLLVPVGTMPVISFHGVTAGVACLPVTWSGSRPEFHNLPVGYKLAAEGGLPNFVFLRSDLDGSLRPAERATATERGT